MENKFKNLHNGAFCPHSRLSGIDLTRSLAIISVIAGHFFAFNTPFHDSDFNCSFSMFLQGMGSFFFGMCVPLFMIMTGFLNSGKVKFDRHYLHGIPRILLSYLFFSIITFLFKKHIQHIPLGISDLVKGILDYSMIPYAWYIEMWIGLFLITPFLNVAYNSISDKRMKTSLISVLFVLSAIPYLTNRYGLHLMPGFWMSTYPVLFFIIGRYIKEYQPKVNKCILLTAVLLTCSINPTFSALFISGRPMIQVAGDPWGVFGVILSVSVFLLSYKMEVRHKLLKWCVTKLAILSLDIYLCCYMADRIVYPFFLDRFYINQQQFGKWFFVVVPSVVVISVLIAQIKSWILTIITRLVR